MIRQATIADSEPIAEELWSISQQFKIRQMPSPLQKYASSEVLIGEVRRDLSHWLVCEPTDSQPLGFFSLWPIDHKMRKRWGFAEHSVEVGHFSCLLPGEAILRHLQLLASHMPQENILLRILSLLREAYWAALKSGFQQLGESKLIVGCVVWLLLDREGRRDQIQAKLNRSRIISN